MLLMIQVFHWTLYYLSEMNIWCLLYQSTLFCREDSMHYVQVHMTTCDINTWYDTQYIVVQLATCYIVGNYITQVQLLFIDMHVCTLYIPIEHLTPAFKKQLSNSTVNLHVESDKCIILWIKQLFSMCT